MVELLIVISLIGVLAVAVLAAINPIEQANRARDAKYKADSSQLVAGIERYFVATEEFPWQTKTPATYTSSDIAYAFGSAKDGNVGICNTSGTCATAGSANDGNLITKNELKPEFRNRDFVTAEDNEWANLIYVGKNTGSGENVYVCYVPKSKSERAKATRTLAVGALVTGGPVADCATRLYGSLAASCVTCLPQ